MEGIQEASKRDASGSDLECSPAPKRPLYCRTATFYFVMALLVDPLSDNVRCDIGHDRHNKTDKIVHREAPLSYTTRLLVANQEGVIIALDICLFWEKTAISITNPRGCT